MAAVHCSIVCFFKLGDCLPVKKLVITKETTWQMLQDIKNQVKKISHWAPLFQIVIKLGKLFTVTNLFKSCPFMGSWIYIQTDLDFYRFLTQCHNYWNSCTFNPFLGDFLFTLSLVLILCMWLWKEMHYKKLLSWGSEDRPL